MRRLIDAEETYEYLASSLKFMLGDEMYSEIMDDTIRDAFDQPTAYDVNEVVDQLKYLKKERFCYGPECYKCKYYYRCSNKSMSAYVAIDKAIEIVKGGGVDAD